MGKSEIERFIEESGNNENSKALTAKLMYSAIERGDFVLECVSKSINQDKAREKTMQKGIRRGNPGYRVEYIT